MVFVTLSSSWNISQRVSRILQGIADVFPRAQALGCHVHFSQPLSSASWNQKFLLDMTEKTLKAVVNGCAWSLRDSQGSLLNQSLQILTASPEVQRVLNHRPCDQRHKHGRLLDHFSAFSLQFPQSLCQTLAKQFLVKDSWNSALGILEQLHAYDDGLPFNPYASSWENPVGLDVAPSEMDIDRNVDMPPAEPPVVEASPTASERKEITNWLKKIHQQIGHRDNRTLVRLLK